MKLIANKKMKIGKFVKKYKLLVGEENKTKFFEDCLIDMATISAHRTIKTYFVMKCGWCKKQFKKARRDVWVKANDHYCCQRCLKSAWHKSESIRINSEPILLNNERF